MNDSVKLVTFGCRLNIFESEVIRRSADEAGLRDAVIINTCSVTNEAERQARQAIRKAKKNNPQSKIIVTGCSAQLNPDVYKNMSEVDFVLGNQEKLVADSYRFDHKPKLQVNDIMSVREGAEHLVASFENHVRAFIEIQNGCDHRCTFCTIPFSRGNNRSVPVGFLVDQIKDLVTNGVKEVILTGVDITDYGGDLPGSPKLSSLVRRILNLVPDLPRLRLSSLDPKEIDDDLIDLFANEIRLMPHVHLSLQSGDPMILKRMKRRHCPEDALSVVSKLRSVRPDIVFGADIIAGFPTETEEMFQNTIRHLRECGIVYLHSFPYSARQGTPAARMPQVEKPVIKERAKILREIASAALDEFLRNKIGQKVNVLLERNMQGRADDYAPFKCFAGGDWSAYALGDVLGVKVVDVEDGFLIIQTIS